MNDITTSVAPLKERILASITEAHDKDRQYMDTHFSLGSAFTHCKRLESYLTLEARAALKISVLSLCMPSEYCNPTIQVTGDINNINAEQLEAAMTEIAAFDAQIAAMRAAELAKIHWNDLRTVAAGKFVRVVAGRKVAKGLVAVVKRVSPNDFDKFNHKVALGTPDGMTHYTYADNCEVILPTVG